MNKKDKILKGLEIQGVEKEMSIWTLLENEKEDLVVVIHCYDDEISWYIENIEEKKQEGFKIVKTYESDYDMEMLYNYTEGVFDKEELFEEIRI